MSTSFSMVNDSIMVVFNQFNGLVSAIIHFFIIFFLITFMYDKKKVPLLPLPFQFLLASCTPAQIGLLMSYLTILLLWLPLKFIQVFHTCSHSVFRYIFFLASGRYYLSRESNRENDLLC